MTDKHAPLASTKYKPLNWLALIVLMMWPIILVVALIAAAIGELISATPAHAATPTQTATVDRVVIPPTSTLYRIKLEREVAARIGTTDAVARIAAQIHNESRWNPKAQSPYAHGMAQFTPATAAWLKSVCPEIGPSDAWDPNWSVRAIVCYDHHLYQQVTGADECERWAFTLSSYNGGLGWVNRDKRLAKAAGNDPERWFSHVDGFTRRAGWAKRENRAYVQRILELVEPVYFKAGWPGVIACRMPSFRNVNAKAS